MMKRWNSSTYAGIVNWPGLVRYARSVTENVIYMLSRKNLFWCPNDQNTMKSKEDVIRCNKCNEPMTKVGVIND